MGEKLFDDQVEHTPVNIGLLYLMYFLIRQIGASRIVVIKDEKRGL